jgi:hypothetical protein
VGTLGEVHPGVGRTAGRNSPSVRLVLEFKEKLMAFMKQITLAGTAMLMPTWTTFPPLTSDGHCELSNQIHPLDKIA